MTEYQIREDHELKIVRVLASGLLTQALGQEMITKARLLAGLAGYGILYDMRDATTRVTPADWLNLVRDLDVLHAGLTRGVKVSVLTSPQQAEDYDFYQDLAANAGLHVRVFTDEDSALAWLR